MLVLPLYGSQVSACCFMCRADNISCAICPRKKNFLPPPCNHRDGGMIDLTHSGLISPCWSMNIEVGTAPARASERLC
ncbi:hypothetical protein ACTXQV_58205, partial [Klebsiella pneumoniae]